MRKRKANFITPISEVLTPVVPFMSFAPGVGNAYRKKSAFLPVDPSISPVQDSPTNEVSPSHDMQDEPIGDTRHAQDIEMNAEQALSKPSNPLYTWIHDRDLFLEEELRREGRRGHDYPLCPRCQQFQCCYRCRECEGGEILCHTCIVDAHKYNGLHHIEKWNGQYFEHETLRNLNLRFQLGHPVGEACPFPEATREDDFVVIHTNGIHEVGLDFCGCPGAAERPIQLYRFSWFPATTDRPRTAATMDVLKLFQIMSFESKCSAHEFYQALTRLTDNTGTRPQRDRYRAFLRIILEYRHIKMIKRAGRGHDSRGVAGTHPGECAVLCPACPQPGLNLPPNWEAAPPHERWLYRLFLAIDANFRLRRRLVSSETADPGLSGGWAYFVDPKAYNEHLTEHGAQTQPKSTCASHSAVNNSRITDGLAVTGVGSVGCARHDCMRPHSVGDLQKGERYVNMDYLFFSSLTFIMFISLVVSYDIACQWAIHLWERMQNYRHHLHLTSDQKTSTLFLVPKFHLPAHIESCQTQYSFNLHSHVGRTDGEAPERGWSQINPLALSTSEMGPGSRRDTINDHFGDWNWKKTYQMGLGLLNKIKEAVEERADHMFRFNELTQNLRKTMKEEVSVWEDEIVAWEANPQVMNPFESRTTRVTEQSVRLALAAADRQEQQTGTAYVLHTQFSASELISVGLELEEQQRRLRLDSASLGQHATETQKAKTLVRGNALLRRINQWIEVQEFYMPCAKILRGVDANTNASTIAEVQPYAFPLFLPSSIPTTSHCDQRLFALEWQLRTAQMQSGLDELRRALRLRAYLFIDKDRFARGQRQNTRARSLIDRVQIKVDAATEKYRVARHCVSLLASQLNITGWEKEFPALQDEDIRSLQVEKSAKRQKIDRKKAKAAQKKESEGRRKVSWIWGSLEGSDESIESLAANEGLRDDLRVEWCKAQARAHRWQEEVLLLREEMRRVLMFFQSQVALWQNRSNFQKPKWDRTQVEGVRAYAQHQAALRTALFARFTLTWKHVDEFIALSGLTDILPQELVATLQPDISEE